MRLLFWLPSETCSGDLAGGFPPLPQSRASFSTGIPEPYMAVTGCSGGGGCSATGRVEVCGVFLQLPTGLNALRDPAGRPAARSPPSPSDPLASCTEPIAGVSGVFFVSDVNTHAHAHTSDNIQVYDPFVSCVPARSFNCRRGSVSQMYTCKHGQAACPCFHAGS